MGVYRGRGLYAVNESNVGPLALLIRDLWEVDSMCFLRISLT